MHVSVLWQNLCCSKMERLRTCGEVFGFGAAIASMRTDILMSMVVLENNNRR